MYDQEMNGWSTPEINISSKLGCNLDNLLFAQTPNCLCYTPNRNMAARNGPYTFLYLTLTIDQKIN